MTSRTLLAAGSAIAAVLIGTSAVIAANSGMFDTGYDKGVGRLSPVIVPGTTSGSTAVQPRQPVATLSATRPSRARTTPAPTDHPASRGTSESEHATVPGHDDDD